MSKIAPYVLISVRSSGDLHPEDLAPTMRSWAGDQGTECTQNWADFARTSSLADSDGRPLWEPVYAWQGTHRWVACVREAGREHHLYAGVTVANDGLPEVRAVAKKAVDLFDRVEGLRLKRDGRKIRTTPDGQLHVRGAETGRFITPTLGWWAVARSRKTLREATALGVAALGASVGTSPPTSLLAALRQLLIVGITLLLAYIVLTTLKWVEQDPADRWEIREWPA